MVYLGGKFALLSAYMSDSEEPHSAAGYNYWVTNVVKNQYILVLNQLVFGTLEAYFQMKEGVKSGDTEVLMAGMIELEKIFFIKKSLRNYQQSAAYRGQDLVKMPPEMLQRRLKYQTTSATAYNSVNIPGANIISYHAYLSRLIFNHSSYYYSYSIFVGDKSVEGTEHYSNRETNSFIQKSTEQRRQGNDACIEQVIKRSKKGANIKVCKTILKYSQIFYIYCIVEHGQ